MKSLIEKKHINKEYNNMFAKDKISQSMIDAVNSVIGGESVEKQSDLLLNEGKVDDLRDKQSAEKDSDWWGDKEKGEKSNKPKVRKVSGKSDSGKKPETDDEFGDLKKEETNRFIKKFHEHKDSGTLETFTDNNLGEEGHMTPAQTKKREKIVLSMKDKQSEFKAKYGKRWKDVMYATATKMAMKEELDDDDVKYHPGETDKRERTVDMLRGRVKAGKGRDDVGPDADGKSSKVKLESKEEHDDEEEDKKLVKKMVKDKCLKSEMINPKNPRDPEIPTIMRNKKGLAPLTMKDIKDKYMKPKGDYKIGKVKEEVEPLSELSRKKISAYLNKVRQNIDLETSPEKRKKGFNLALKKKWGDEKYGTTSAKVPATDEVESINELSPKTLDSYKDKASDDALHHVGQSIKNSLTSKSDYHLKMALKRSVGGALAQKKLIAKEEFISDLEESVTRKHFQQVADIIKSHESHDKRKELAQHHAGIFATQNPRFDRSKFMKAANVQESVDELDEAGPGRTIPSTKGKDDKTLDDYASQGVKVTLGKFRKPRGVEKTFGVKIKPGKGTDVDSKMKLQCGLGEDAIGDTHKSDSGWHKAGAEVVTDKSGAKHTPMSRVKDLARAALKKVKNHVAEPTEPKAKTETMMGKISN